MGFGRSNKLIEALGFHHRTSASPFQLLYKLYSRTRDLDVFFSLFSQTMVSVPKINNLWQSPVQPNLTLTSDKELPVSWI